ncbi:putative Cobalamin synthase [Nitrospina gracilis 3/211]|uniref:Adenosylcobinamide-GDP ribazoletransferase n=1 Tax=Nitrospina gracilis (strain 3/211) TaxID=1266370 RepID=M1YYT2_NITG3|nr:MULTISPECIES: adenosylcobinamide-GDP ribazoletransferase [Nitrospina]MCF8723366.1 adenosylcobinamide-GDP ribazoletransferase [Nitrospina sp. Nb-3]CCQ90421.1 putative Cobalamin synthase [Nitrospina gracilis 3/211]
MSAFFSALSFLSILPGPSRRTFDTRMVSHFPVVGLLIGGLLVAVDMIASWLFPPFLRAVVDVAFLAIITGALHLDGLADSADGLFSHRPCEEALAIMKDPRIGVMGAVALVLCLALKVAAVHGLSGPSTWLWLVIAPAFARSTQVIALATMPDARGGAGMGAPLYASSKTLACLVCILPLALPFFFDLRIGVCAVLVFAAVTSLALVYFHRRIGGMTGDTFGALSELVETALLVAGAAFHHASVSSAGFFFGKAVSP